MNLVNDNWFPLGVPLEYRQTKFGNWVRMKLCGMRQIDLLKFLHRNRPRGKRGCKAKFTPEQLKARIKERNRVRRAAVTSSPYPTPSSRLWRKQGRSVLEARAARVAYRKKLKRNMRMVATACKMWMNYRFGWRPMNR